MPESNQAAQGACAHDSCRCRQAPIDNGGKKYCSDHCQQAAQGRSEPQCRCGHPDCAGNKK
ncbi:MAG TPA: hypothetical protein VGR00_09300 [Thermoanaerobaculia bacterium]|jgi:hypothetical protein|nr:hypothetical protein [Thermoanaerobaculia bacterium]